MVNHFLRNNVITTKVGLCHSLENLVWCVNTADKDTFFPKCFDVTWNAGPDEDEREDFLQEYRFIKAESIVKSYVA